MVVVARAKEASETAERAVGSAAAKAEEARAVVTRGTGSAAAATAVAAAAGWATVAAVRVVSWAVQVEGTGS